MQMPPIGIDFGGNEEAALDFQISTDNSMSHLKTQLVHS